ncbi:hypothetical protein HOT42_gp19 [Microbacterium phage Metamorphoo]|uniref:Uncharacterized protein n=1 Tax=Microbacterium phage Metamorphoo TaxID=2201437 RepID=A0A2Z4Q5Z6_9CAUD|nr:hypothetical protein HOT42_gp19 [Microbacterium phage Metamorphoo]AWY05370.1 hypothetical protein SEA_METAMORPHOO_19 [Microbacterium phage Metamorphoo]
MITIPEGMPRPSVTEVLAHGAGGYQSVDLSNPDGALFTEHRLEMVGHEPCGWTNPTWPDEAAGRLAAHLTTCAYPA